MRPVVIRIGLKEPSRSTETAETVGPITEAFQESVHRSYNSVMIRHCELGEEDLLERIHIGCFDGIPVGRRSGARRRAIARMLGDILGAYRARGVACRVNRVLDTRMTGDEYRAAESYPGEEGSFDGEAECAISAREPGLEIECPLCGRGTTMARRGSYPRDRAAAAGEAEWRRRGLQGEPRPTLQWVRPHGTCGASNAHSLVLVPAGAPPSGELRDFVLAKAFMPMYRIPHVYGRAGAPRPPAGRPAGAGQDP